MISLCTVTQLSIVLRNNCFEETTATYSETSCLVEQIFNSGVELTKSKLANIGR